MNVIAVPNIRQAILHAVGSGQSAAAMPDAGSVAGADPTRSALESAARAESSARPGRAES
jgi:hypothetical protein